MIWRLANALVPERPLHVDRLFDAGGNSRSVLEALLAHTPQFHYCYPGRLEVMGSANPRVSRGTKHLIWTPNRPHRSGEVVEVETNQVISQIPSVDAVYETLVIPPVNHEIDIDVTRRHSQIQIALLLIGRQLGFRTWIARNDRGIIYDGQRIDKMPGVINDLHDEPLLGVVEGAHEAAALIDVIWLRNNGYMPAVLEIEHTTGIITGLNRMLGFRGRLPPIETRGSSSPRMKTEREL